MKNQVIFLIIILFSSLAGIFLSILNNDISKENQHNLKKDNIKKANGEDNKNNKTIIPTDIKPKEDESDKNNNQKLYILMMKMKIKKKKLMIKRKIKAIIKRKNKKMIKIKI